MEGGRSRREGEARGEEREREAKLNEEEEEAEGKWIEFGLREGEDGEEEMLLGGGEAGRGGSGGRVEGVGRGEE